MENGSRIMLGLKEHIVQGVDEEEMGILVTVKPAEAEVTICPHCGSTRLYRHGSGMRRVLHSWINGKKIYLEVQRQRWRCCACRRCFGNGTGLVRRYSRITKQGETEILWHLRDRSFSQLRRDMGVSYSTARRLMEKEIDEETIGSVRDEAELCLGIDEHSFRHQELVHTITEIKTKRMLGVLKDDRIVTLKTFLSKIPQEKVTEVCIDMKESLRKTVEHLFPKAKVVADHFHVIADANRRIDEARRIEQDVHRKRKVMIPKRLFLIAREKLGMEKQEKIDRLLDTYPSLKGFYWAKEKLREMYRQETHGEAVKLLDSIIFSLKSDDDGELIRWGNTLKHWREPILNHFYTHATNAFTEGCNTKIKMLKRVSYGLRNVEVYWRKMLLGFVPSRTCFHNI